MTTDPDNAESAKLYTQADIDDIIRTFGKLPYGAQVQFDTRGIKAPFQVANYLSRYAQTVMDGIRTTDKVQLEHRNLLADQQAMRRFLGIDEILEKLEKLEKLGSGGVVE